MRALILALALLLASGASVHVGGAESASAEVHAFVAAAKQTQPEPAIETYRQRTIGSTNRASEAIIALVLAGLKTGTFSLAAEFAGDPAAMPRVGEHVVVTRFDGEPALIYRLTEVTVVPFGEISEELIQVEGPTLRELEPWREVHLRAWQPLLDRVGQASSASMPVVFQRFVVVYPVVRPKESGS